MAYSGKKDEDGITRWLQGHSTYLEWHGNDFHKPPVRAVCRTCGWEAPLRDDVRTAHQESMDHIDSEPAIYR